MDVFVAINSERLVVASQQEPRVGPKMKPPTFAEVKMVTQRGAQCRKELGAGFFVGGIAIDEGQLVQFRIGAQIQVFQEGLAL